MTVFSVFLPRDFQFHHNKRSENKVREKPHRLWRPGVKRVCVLVGTLGRDAGGMSEGGCCPQVISGPDSFVPG